MKVGQKYRRAAALAMAALMWSASSNMTFFYGAAIENTSNSGLKIGTIQGEGETSPYINQKVTDVQGVVTSYDDDGFYMQDPEGDGNDKTSDGIYVYKSDYKVSVGDLVKVEGIVREHREGAKKLSITRIEQPKVGFIKAKQDLPAPIVIGQGGRIPTDDASFYESLESMYVQINQAQVVEARNNNKFYIVPDAGACSGGLITEKGGAVISENDNHPEIMAVASGMEKNERNVLPGDVFMGSTYGVLGCEEDVHTIYLTQKLPNIKEHTYKDTTKTSLYNEKDYLRVANYQLESIGTNTSLAKIKSLAKEIIYNLDAPDILVLQGIQDDSGNANDGMVTAYDFYSKLLSEVQGQAAETGAKYNYVQIDPQNNAEGIISGDNKRTAILYRMDKLSLDNKTKGDSTTSTTIVAEKSGQAALSVNPGRITPNAVVFNNSQKPLAVQFNYRNQRLFVIATDLNAETSEQRALQAQSINNFIKEILAVNGTSKIIVAGGINDNYFSNTAKNLAGDELYNMLDSLKDTQRATQIMKGRLSAVDSMYVSKGLKDYTKMEILHINTSKEKEKRTSSHDPMIMKVNMMAKIEGVSAINIESITTENKDPLTLQKIALPQEVNEANSYVEVPVYYGNTSGRFTAYIAKEGKKAANISGNVSIYARGFVYRIGEVVQSGIQIAYENSKGELVTEWWKGIDVYNLPSKAEEEIKWPKCTGYSIRILDTIRFSSANNTGDTRVELTIKGKNGQFTRDTTESILIR